MDKCKCWHEEHPMWSHASGRCSGTKELDLCDCGGDETKCDFYPEKRKSALVSNLKPCPFCGYEHPTLTYWSGGGCWRIDCPNCDIVFRLGAGAKEKMKDRIVDAWNRRANDE